MHKFLWAVVNMWKLMEAQTMFWQSAAADFLGSVLAGLLLWGLVTRFYDLPKSRKENGRTVAVAYALIKRELKAASIYCEDLKTASPDEISMSPPITQAWETLHSTEAFKLFPVSVTEKLVGCYSLVFRLSSNIELIQKFFLCAKISANAEDYFKTLRARANNYIIQIALEILQINQEFYDLLDSELKRMTKTERDAFDNAYQRVGKEQRVLR